MRRIRAGRLAMLLVGISLAAGCGGSTEPESPDIPDLGVPEFVLVDGLELRARLDVTQASPPTRVRVIVSATNDTDGPIEFVAGSPCFVRPLLYARGVDEWIRYPGSPEVTFDLCPQIVVFLTVPAGETLTLSDREEFSVADWVGMEFRRGTYVVTATVASFVDERRHEVELLAGQVDAR